MAKIIINAVTHRTACLDALGEADAVAYDGAITGYFAKVAEQAAAEGFDFEVDQQGQGPASYRVTDERDEADLNAAHDFMQHSVNGFWEAF